jgi:hypothetical protein
MDDPERKAAEEHARACAPCAAALAEGQHLFSLLGQATPIAPPSAEALRRVAATIEQESGQADRGYRALRWAAAGALMVVWLLQLAYGKRLAHDINSVLISIGMLVVVLAGLGLLRARQALFAGLTIATSALFASVLWGASGLEPRAGVECTGCELVAAAISLLVVATLARRRHLALDRWTTMAVAAAGAVASQAAQLLACPVARANPHLLVFHFGGVLLAAAFGALSPVGAAPAVL